MDQQNNNWFGLDNGYLVKYSCDFPTNIDAENEQIPVQYSLSQNYPRQFNPNTKVRFTIRAPPTSSFFVKDRTELEFVNMKACDVLDNEIALLVNEEKTAGSYMDEFGASRLPRGVSSIICNRFFC